MTAAKSFIKLIAYFFIASFAGAVVWSSGCTPQGPTDNDTLHKLSPAQIVQLRPDMYEHGDPAINEENFKQTITDAGYVWVQYALTKPTVSQNDGEMFWNDLKYYYGNQVDGFITVKVPKKSQFEKIARKEIKQNKYPSFCLYKNGKVVNDGTPNDIRQWGPPDYDNILDVKKAFKYIEKHSNLKRKE